MKKTAFAVTVNVALQRSAVQSSTYETLVASLAVDGNLNTGSCTGSTNSPEPWLSVDLGTPMDVSRVCVTNDGHQDFGKPCEIFLCGFCCLNVDRLLDMIPRKR